ncbi:MAG: hypothetical protein RL007_290, partial [Bacteroidota bacterium]
MNLKQRLLLALLLIVSGITSARQLYWVNGSGNWNDSYHWSVTPDGFGGDGVPTINDDIFIPISATSDTVFVNDKAYCRDFNFGTSKNMAMSGSMRPCVLKGNGSIHIGGNVAVDTRFIDQFEGDWYLQDAIANARDNSIPEINTSGHVFTGKFHFTNPSSGSSSYSIASDFFVKNKITVENKCRLIVQNNVSIAALSVDTSAGSSIVLENNARLLTQRNQNPSPQAFTVTTTIVPNPCNGDCIATATAVVTGGVGPFTYQWSTVPVQNTATATGLCAG